MDNFSVLESSSADDGKETRIWGYFGGRFISLNLYATNLNFNQYVWNHMAIMCDGYGTTMRLYINGTSLVH